MEPARTSDPETPNVRYYLTQTTKAGKKAFWEAEVVGGTVTYRWGNLPTEKAPEPKIQTKTDVPVPKRKNTPYQQALQVARTKTRIKLRKGCVQEGGDEIDASEGTVSDATALPMQVSWHHDRAKFLDPTEPCDFQNKMDGFRALLDLSTGVFASRGGKHFANELPEVHGAIASIREALEGTGVTHVDGEMIVVDEDEEPVPFQEVTKVLRKKGRDSSGARLCIFDVVLAGDPGANWLDRKVYLDMLEETLDADLPVSVVQTRTGFVADLDEDLHEAVHTDGAEGIVMRLHARSPYLLNGKRSLRVIKAKYFPDAEFEVVGFEAEKGFPDRVGSVVLRTGTGKLFKAAPGVKETSGIASPWGTEEAKERLWEEQEMHLGRMATIKYQDMTTSKDPVPRFPNFIDFRDD